MSYELDPQKSLFDKSEMLLIWNYLNQDEPCYVRYRPMFGILSRLGIRVSEMCSIQMSDIVLDYERPYVWINRLKKGRKRKVVKRLMDHDILECGHEYVRIKYDPSKGHHRRCIECLGHKGARDRILLTCDSSNVPEGEWRPDDLVHDIQEYLKQRGNESGPLFKKPLSGKMYSRREVYELFQKLLKKCKVRPRPVHALRHTCLTDFYDATGDMLATAKLAGHSDIKMTASFYLDIRMQEQENMLQKVSDSYLTEPELVGVIELSKYVRNLKKMNIVKGA